MVAGLGGTMIRLGNFFNSEIVGSPTTLPWGVKFEQLAPANMSVEQIIPLHPAQIYEAICYFIIFIVLITLYYKKYPNLKPGLITGLFFIMLFTSRFLIEFVKQDQVSFEEGMALNMGQILSIPFIIVGLILVFRKTRPIKVESKNSPGK